MKLQEKNRVFVYLLIFGFLFNLFTGLLRERYPRHGYTSILVVAGNLVTLIALIPRIGPDAFVSVLLGFVASGTPMILGDAYRNLEASSDVDSLVSGTIHIMGKIINGDVGGSAQS